VIKVIHLYLSANRRFKSVGRIDGGGVFEVSDILV